MRGVLAKVALGEADAGFVYSTDAKTVPGKVNVIKLPAWAQPNVTYAMAVVSSSTHKTAAKKFIAEVLSKAGRRSCSPRASCRCRGNRLRRALLAVAYFAAAGITLAFLSLPCSRSSSRVPPGDSDRPALEPGRHRRADRQLQDDAGRAGAHPALRDADRLRARHPPLPRPAAPDHARRAADRAAARRRRHRPARRVRPHRAARRDARALGSRSRSRRPPSSLAVTSSRARSTSARRSPRSRRSTRTSSPRRARSAPGRCGRSSASRCRSRAAGSSPGEALAFARGLGEFGATIMFAGSLQGVTQTLPLAIYAEFDGRLRRRARDQRAARPDQPRDPARAEARLPWQPSRHDFALPLRSFELELELDVERTVALVGPSGAGKTSVLRAVAGLARPRAGGSRSATTSGSTRAQALSARRTNAGSGSCSRSTRSSRT